MARRLAARFFGAISPGEPDPCGVAGAGLTPLDAIIVLVLAVAAAVALFAATSLVEPVLLREYDVWFQADVPRTYLNLTLRTSNQFRACVHPLFSLVGFSAVKGMEKALGVPLPIGARVFSAATAALWVGCLYLLLRLMTGRRTDALVFTLLASVSAAVIFWFTVPETYALGSLSLLLCLCVVALSRFRNLSSAWYVLAGVATFSFTVTNWMAGIIAAWTRFGLRKAVQISVNALCIVLILWSTQIALFHHDRIGFPLMWAVEKNYILRPDAGGPLRIVPAFFCHSMVMPEIVAGGPQGNRLSVQYSRPGSGGPLGLLSTGLWVVLLAIGLRGLLSPRGYKPLRVVLGLTVAGQLALHLLYGDETFLYALHYGPLLVLVAACGVFTRARPVVLALAVLLAGTAFANNARQFQTAMAHFQRTQRHEVLAAIRRRSADPWPRGAGHVLLAVPGSTEEQKSYQEPGGSFSPSVGSFGVSVWITDSKGNLLTTGDQIPLDQVSQRFEWKPDGVVPTLRTETPYYDAIWSLIDARRRQLDVTWKAAPDRRHALAIRSTGPAGGPIRLLAWDGRRLLVNDRWEVAITPQPVAVHLAAEGPDGWQTATPGVTQWSGSDGWGCARIEPGAATSCTLSIIDRIEGPVADLAASSTRASVVLELPDERFAECLHAQVAHLMMSLVGRETRPGDPMNYPLQWERDGAYVLTGLARSGRLGVARELSVSFAVNDFFGGFGPEADGPGSSIWALDEVAVCLRQPEYDEWLWPQVERKIALIERMLTTNRKVYAPVMSPVVDALASNVNLDLVCDRPSGGLISGRMDGTIRPMYVSAVSYGGLMRAADLAERLGKTEAANRWRATATALRESWARAFTATRQDDPRTFICSLWPTWVAGPVVTSLADGLENQWKSGRTPDGGFVDRPDWTYFEVANAHQRLFLGQVDRVWQTLEWFWRQQASPGLYTWWEGSGEENSFHRWENVRGWVMPPNVTPHYWTAAEMLLLQLDMLAYDDGTAARPTLVIGAGIPKPWLERPLRIEGLLTRRGRVDWTWSHGEVRVKIMGDPCDIRLGPAFPAATPVHVERLESRPRSSSPRTQSRSQTASDRRGG